MNFSPPFPHQDRRLAGFAATVALHLALLALWSAAHKRPRTDSDEAARIQWVNIAPPQALKSPAPPKPTKPPAVPRATARQAARPAGLDEPLAMTVPAPAEAPVPAPVGEAAPARSAAEMMQQARRDLGKIDKDLQKEFPGARIKAPPDSPQIRLVKGIEHAAEMAPPKWYEAPKVEELIDPGGYGRRRYRVITANGTYCVTIESNHAPDGIDTMKNGIKPKITTCPKDETPATSQKW